MRVVTAGGAAFELGAVEATPTIGITDYSNRVTDDFGVTTVVPRAFSRRMSVKLAVPFAGVDALQRRLADLRATSALWVANDRLTSLSVQGFYKDFSLDLATRPLSYCTLTIEGLAETVVPADVGGDPAPAGLPSTLRMLQPTTIVDGSLTASSVPENDTAEWANATSYPTGARVMKAATHRLYESLVNANAGNDPAAAAGKWLDVGPTNRWAMFDQARGTVTMAARSIVVTLDAGGANAIALLDVSAATVRVQATGYDRTLPAGAGAITFLDLPAGVGQVTVTIAGSATVSVGTLIIGRLVALGITEASPTAGITDFSKKTIDDFGEVTIVPRAWSKTMTAKALIRTDGVDMVAARIAAVRARPSLWIGQAGTDALTIYGFFKDFSIEVGETVSKLSLSIEGLSEAAKIEPLTAAVDWPNVGDPDGTKPADNADKTSENTSKDTSAVSGRPAGQVLSGIDDLKKVFGDTVNAAASADAAAGYAATSRTAADQSVAARAAAQDAQALASTQAGLADTARSASQAARDVATGAATLATSKAGLADTGAAAAQAARDAAGSASALAGNSKDAAAASAAISAGAASLATAARDAAGTARDAAQSAQTAANTKAAEAAQSATGAAGSASTASGQATMATQKADAAGTSASTASAKADIATTKAGEASVSASNAATSDTNAQGSASTATTQAGLSTTARGQAEGFAAAASGSASTAASRASEAGTSASASTTARDAAQTAKGLAEAASTRAASSESNAAGSANSASTSASVSASYASTAEAIARNKDDLSSSTAMMWSFNRWTEINPVGPRLNTLQSSTVTFYNDRIRVYASQLIHLHTVATTNIKAGRLYRISAFAAQTADATSPLNANMYVVAWNASGQITDDTTPIFSAPVLPNTVMTSQLIGLAGTPGVQIALAATASIIRPMFRLSVGGPTTAYADFMYLSIVDVTDSYKAEQAASAAVTSASTASTKASEAGVSASAAKTSETNAGTSAGNALAYQNNAASSASNALGSSQTATTQAGLATTAKGQAQGAADAASGSASTASTKASEASSSASAASADRVLAQTAKGQADASATRAATSESNALGSSNSAASSAGVSASARDIAKTAALALMPSTFEQESLNWTFNLNGAAGTQPDMPSNVVRYVATSYGKSAEFFDTIGSPTTKARLRGVPGRTYRVTILARSVYPAGVPTTHTNVYIIGNAPTDATSWTALAVWQVDMPTDGTWVRKSFDWLCDRDINVLQRADVNIGPDNATFSGAQTRVNILALEDVTAEVKSAASASAASTSASAASASAYGSEQSALASNANATNANTLAGQALGYRNDAASSASTAAGSAQTATQQAGVATTAKGLAQGSADAASGSAITASTKAGEASSSASAASADRQLAQTAKGLAEAASTRAATSESNALGSSNSAASSSSVSAGYASAAEGIARNKDVPAAAPIMWSFNQWSVFNPVGPRLNSLASSTLQFFSDRIRLFSAQTLHVHPVAMTIIKPGRLYRVSVLVGLTADGTTPQNANLYLSAWDASGTLTDDATLLASAPTVPGSLQLTSGLIGTAGTPGVQTAVSAVASNVRPMYRMSIGGPATAYMDLLYISIVDVTDSYKAEQQASAAATSASNASTSQSGANTSAIAANTSATNAGTSAGQALSYRNDASTSASSAAGSAQTATTQAGLAATAKGQAQGSADAASGSASTASTKASDASSAASAATGARDAAQTAKGLAEAASTRAATSESNASGSANSASTSASTSATARDASIAARDAASASASAASTNASSAAASNGTAGQASSAATAARDAAQTAKGQAEAAQGRAATSADNAAGSASSAATSSATSAAYASNAAGYALSKDTPAAAPKLWSFNQWAVLNPTGVRLDSLSGPAFGFYADRIRMYGTYGGTVHVHPVAATAIKAGRLYRAFALIGKTAAGTSPASNTLFVSSWDASGTNLDAAIGVVDLPGGNGELTSGLIGTVGTPGATITVKAGAALIRAMFRMAISGGTDAYLDLMYVGLIDVTETYKAEGSASAASTQASNALTQATNAGIYAGAASTSANNALTYQGGAQQAAGTASSAAAAANASQSSTSALVTQASSFGFGAMNKNAVFAAPGFDFSADPAVNQTIPPSWQIWAFDQTYAAPSFIGPDGSPNVYGNHTLRINRSGKNVGVMQTFNCDAAGWYVMEAELLVNGGDWLGTGMHCNYGPDSTSFNFSTEADTNGLILSGNYGTKRKFSKLFRKEKYGGSTTVYAMGGWEGFASGSAFAYTIWEKCLIRPATQGEIDGRQAKIDAANNAARISQVSETLTTNLGALATRTSAVEARAGGVEGRTAIVESAVATTNSKLAAARLELSATSPGGRASVVIRSDSNGGAGVDLVGDVRIAGSLVVDGTITSGKVAASAVQQTVFAILPNSISIPYG